MALPRLQLFEFNDSSWAPRALRDTIVESLSRTLLWGHFLGGLVAPFEEFLARAGVSEVLDVGAGAAGPARIMAREIPRRWAQAAALRPHRSAAASRRLAGGARRVSR